MTKSLVCRISMQRSWFMECWTAGMLLQIDNGVFTTATSTGFHVTCSDSLILELAEFCCLMMLAGSADNLGDMVVALDFRECSVRIIKSPEVTVSFCFWEYIGKNRIWLCWRIRHWNELKWCMNIFWSPDVALSWVCWCVSLAWGLCFARKPSRFAGTTWNRIVYQTSSLCSWNIWIYPLVN